MAALKKFTFLLLIFALTTSLNSQNKTTISSFSGKIPPDPDVKIGKLENGITYYIKVNKKPEKRAELMLAIKAGAILEDEDQKGLAHFCEHMCFNGTKNFPKADLVNYLESIGVRFGSDLNAYTSYDETVYTLTLPTNKDDQFEKGMQVLEDWGHNVSFDNNEIDKERGVILEEWRLRKGAEDRVRKKHYPVIFYNSQYAKRDIIGDTNIITKCPYDALKRFYNDWYRPDLMAVIAVGDFDLNKMEAMIKAHFSAIPPKQNPRPRVEFNMPAHKEAFVSIATDKELSFPSVNVYFKREGREKGTYDDYLQNIKAMLFDFMLNSRLDEIRRTANTPFRFARVNEGDFEGNSRAYTLMAAAKGDAINQSLETILGETFRVIQKGFTSSELDRAKNEVLSRIESVYAEKDKQESRNLEREYLQAFINKESIPGITKELELTKSFLSEISLKEINALPSEYFKKENTVITISAPERKDVKVPTKDEVLAIWDKLSKEAFTAYNDNVSEKPLLDKDLKPGKIASEKYIKDIDVTELTLSNGVKVVLKPTDFKNDEIMFTSFSPGGTSLLADKDYYAASVATSVLSESGIGQYDQNQLGKYLTGKIVNVRAGIDDLYESLAGGSSPKDIETMFQLIYLKFTEPRKDPDAFKSYVEKLKAQIKDNKNSPRAVFGDTSRVTLTNYHFREKPVTEDIIGKYNLDKAYNFYKERFADASDFTFIFVGNFKVDEIKLLLVKYLGNLPSTNRKETWKDVGVNFPKGLVKKEVRKGIEKQSTVRLVWNGKFEWNRENRYLLQAAMEVLNIKLREVLREDKGGVYGVRGMAIPKHFPKDEYTINIFFGCSPDRVDELINAVTEQMKLMTENKPDETYLTKVREIQIREREVSLKQNRFWMQRLNNYYLWNEDPTLVIKDDEMISNLKAEDVLKAANKYFNLDNYCRLVLYPEK